MAVNVQFGATQNSFEGIEWIEQACLRISKAGTVIYTDPLKITKSDKADLILVTHKHQDHFSLTDIYKVLKKSTVLIFPASLKTVVNQLFKDNKKIFLKPFECYRFSQKIIIDAIPAYNIKKIKFHPKKAEWLGYVINSQGRRIYIAGDTERIPEMKKVKADICILPLGQTYTMNSVKEAAAAVLDTGAKYAIPYHYGLYEGNEKDAEKFADLLKGKVKVVILTKQSNK